MSEHEQQPFHELVWGEATPRCGRGGLGQRKKQNKNKNDTTGVIPKQAKLTPPASSLYV